MKAMINDSDRREVAKRMRECDVSAFRESAIAPFLDCLGADYMNWRGILDALADLIDRPTCSVECADEDYRKCTACSAKFLVEVPCAFGTCEAVSPNYCPCCGAEVVE